ncbi:cytochrome c biogenesis CcdA family protein [Tissierella creatinophila]|uniref:Thiol:disulfide interchange protein DsbD n=1 Tax=Tissierella creatinophila DSM 6911 TaxID=1123403 RepID=A0A1U7M2F1_TISCR|nr:cytochrome c biogenesis protein CcdA [Tissierella creatinophila]OLS01487.1 thiol:disulfide interchange protein DsbD precursor [Tissierella creatinophila DSM 6911]
MFLQEVSWGVAFVAGFLSFFSACILPLIPAYIMYLTGSTLEEEVNERRLFALTRTLGFVLGFTVIFIIMGVSASFIGKVFVRNRDIFAKVSGILIILFGLNMLGVFKFGIMKKINIKAPKSVTNWFSSVLMGMAFAAGWSPCFGPVLGAILVYAGATETLGQGILLLLIYSFGMAVPFILTSLFINKFAELMDRYENYLKYINIIGGALMIVFGLLVFFDKVVDISRLLL